jgi:hypothetical protein
MANVVLGEPRQGDIRIRSKNGVPTVEETYYFTVLSDNKANSRFSIATTSGLPIPGSTKSSYGLTVCISKEAVRRDENPLIWDVTCEFSSEVDENNTSSDPNTDPTSWIPIYETKMERLQEIVTRDKNDDAIANSAGQPFETGLTVGRFIPMWEFWQIEATSVTDEMIVERNETINSTAFKGRAAKTLLLSIVSSVVGLYYGTQRRLTQYSLKYNKKKWTHKRLDVGTVYLDTTHKPYTDSEGNVILGGLNGSGAKVAAGDPPAVLEFDMYTTSSFSFLRT